MFAVILFIHKVDVEKQEQEVNSRKDRPTGSMHIGDVDYDPNDPALSMDATWGEVLSACKCHTPQDWLKVVYGIVSIFFFLYFFLVGLDFLGTGAKVMSSCAAGALFGDDTNPIAGLMVGILVTVLLQSSSTTTSLIVSLVGADTISVKQGIYMIMGANIGTSVTSTIVAMGHLGDGDQLERAFAGATVHDMFNFLSVAVLLPVEVATGYLFHLTKAMVKGFTSRDGESWDGPIKTLVEPIGKLVIIENKDVTKAVSKGGSCADFYPIVCDDPDNPTYESCSQKGLINCDKSTDKCPAFFQVDSDKHDDVMSGVAVFIIGIALLFICLFGLVTILQKLLLGTSTRIIYKATNVNGYLAILIGAGLTMLVQSSSVTTSALTPLVGLGVLQLEQMLPLTLGANIGTTLTGLLAALLSNGNAMQVALAHLFFNITGILIWYPVPFMRRVPLHAATQLGKATRIWKGFPLVYIGVMFFLFPVILLGISTMFTQDSVGLTVLGIMLVVIMFFAICWTVYYCHYKGGKEKCLECMVGRQTRRQMMVSLPEDMEFLKAKIKELSEHTGLPEEEVPLAPEEKEPKVSSESTPEEEEGEEAA
jgi:sodium-dependent phosphate cotransporter